MNREENLSKVLVGVKVVVETLYKEGYDSRAILQYMDKLVGEQIHDTLQRLDNLKQQQAYSEEDMLKSFMAGIKCESNNGKNFEQFIEQFKKK